MKITLKIDKDLVQRYPLTKCEKRDSSMTILVICSWPAGMGSCLCVCGWWVCGAGCFSVWVHDLALFVCRQRGVAGITYALFSTSCGLDCPKFHPPPHVLYSAISRAHFLNPVMPIPSPFQPFSVFAEHVSLPVCPYCCLLWQF